MAGEARSAIDRGGAFVNIERLRSLAKQRLPEWAQGLLGVAFYRWIVFVMRGNNPADTPYLTPDPPVRGDAQTAGRFE